MRVSFAVFLLLFAVSTAWASASPDGRDIMPQPPSVVGGSVGAFVNPAAWMLQEQTELAFYWNEHDLRPQSLDNWGVSLGRELGFTMQRQSVVRGGEVVSRDIFQVGTAMGGLSQSFGLSWRWSSGSAFDSGLGLGWASRPNRHVSWGVSGFLRDATDPQWGQFDVGLRPFRKPWLTVFTDYSVGDGDKLDDGAWGAGAEVRPVNGLHFGVRVWEEEGGDSQFSLNLGVTLDNLGFHAQPQNRDEESAGDDYTSYLVRLNPPHSGLPAKRELRALGEPKEVAVVDLEKRTLSYDRNTWFVSHRKNWLELSRQLDAALQDPVVTGVALNLSGASMRPSLAWELREKILELRAHGKKVTVHADGYRMGKYYVASAADVVSTDPMSILLLPGVAFHRTYWAGFLEKMGIGAEEWRLFTHKTAFQTYVRTDMSEADKEQIGRLADVIYETWREGICQGRGLPVEAFESLVNNDVIFLSDQSRDKQLVDHVGTWDELRRSMTDQGLDWRPMAERAGAQDIHSDDHWGAIPEIAVVYTVGSCAMDSGIKGRATSKHVARLAQRGHVKGLVLRVDSPGGDPLPCELINRSVNQAKDKGKPVIVSQGDVAASGGYYLSMPGDTVLATPLTVTGSIGVIFGWLWDKGFSEKSGFTADGVQRGEHADLFTGIQLPFLPVKIPERNLTEEELATAKDFISHEYDRFVEEVVQSRGLEESHVRRVAEGRVWMAEDAMEHRLIDGMGGLEDAIELAKVKAGIQDGDVYRVTEYPQKPYFELPSLGFGLGLGRALGLLFPRSAAGVGVEAETESDYETEYYKLLFAQPGRAVFLLPPVFLPDGYGEK